MSSKLRGGALGVSHPHFSGRLKAIQTLDEIELVGIYDADVTLARRLGEETGAKVYSNEEELLRANLDFVIIESTNHENARYALSAIRERKAILLEKPGAHDLPTLKTISQEAERNNVFCQVGYHLRYSPSVQEALNIIENGGVGRITTGRFHVAVMSPWLTDPWFCNPFDRGGLVYLDFCHMLDLLILFLGKPSSHLSKILKLENVPKHPFEDSGAFLFRFGDALIAGDCCGWEVNDWITTWDIELYGMEGTLKLGIHPPWWKLYSPSKGAGWKEWSEMDFDGDKNYLFEMEDFAKRLRGEVTGKGCTLKEAVTILEIIEEMYRANGM
ncbi:MAG TPA: Gfo/Idh/MocA family oxidoreductase [Fimbriimonadales bacterium]|nr:Gfo/Idh/MocA family oxidoreductase [Fimbriimonadales bacterium]